MFNFSSRRFSLPALALAGTLGLGIAAASAAPEIGQPAPVFTGTDSNGGTFNLADHADKTVILEWTNHGCPYVQKHYDTGNMQALQAEAADEGIAWVSIISSAPGKQGHVSGDEANELTTSRDASPTAVILDESGDIGRMYAAKTTPHMYVIQNGTLRYMGAIDDKPTTNPDSVDEATNYVEAALDELADGQPVSTPVTQAYGCSVKY